MKKRPNWDTVRRDKRVQEHGAERIDLSDQTLTDDGRLKVDPKHAPKPKPPPGAKILLKGKVIFVGPPARKAESIDVAREAILRTEQEKAERSMARKAEITGVAPMPRVVRSRW